MRPPHEFPSREEPDGPRRAGANLGALTIVGLAVAAIGLSVTLRVPGMGPMLGGAASLVGLAGVLFAGLMGLGWLGFRLTGLAGRLGSWVRRSVNWPEEDESGRRF